ncbi:MAG: integrase core domain-containing protein [Acidimicrobiales bacterium]
MTSRQYEPGSFTSGERFCREVRADVRQECLDHFLVVSQRHLEAVLAEYLRYYDEARPHRSLDLDQPIPRPATTVANGKVTRRDVLGGIVHEYERAA